MKTTSIYTWYKKVNNLIVKNIENLNIHGFTIEVSFMDIKENHKSIIVTVLKHLDDCCKVVHRFSIASYEEDKSNKKSFKDFKNFLENIETFLESFYIENNDKI